MTPTTDPTPACARAREHMHAVLDGDPLDAAARQGLDVHLGTCSGCREALAELKQIQSVLRAMPALPLPQADLDAVLAQTSRAPATPAPRAWAGWRAVAAAVLLAAILGSLWSLRPAEPDQAEVDQAAADARMVLMLTAKALSRTQQAAIRDVMSGEVAPALRSVPMNMPPAIHNKEL